MDTVESEYKGVLFVGANKKEERQDNVFDKREH